MEMFSPFVDSSIDVLFRSLLELVNIIERHLVDTLGHGSQTCIV